MDSSFRRNLRTELDFHDLTVKELSAKTGIAKGTLDCYLGVRASMPPADAAVKIAKALGISVEYLVTGKDETPYHLYSNTVKEIFQILSCLEERDREIILCLVKALKKTTRPPPPADAVDCRFF
jgi:transcriptional regulator with XRE-family HTH domain